MPFIQENIVEINIGLKNEYKLMHISDVHAVDYNISDPKEEIEEAKKAEDIWLKQRTWFADKANEHYDESHLIKSKECLINLIDYINSENPIAALLTGDIIDYYSKSNYIMLKEEINRLKCPYVFSTGNHETPLSRFSEIIKNDNGISNLDFKEFKIISIDNSLKKVTKETLDYIKEEVKENKPIIISMHIPISTKYNEEEMKKLDPYFVIYENDTDEITKEFINLLVNNKNIKSIICGHIHAYNKSYYADNKIQLCASSGLIGFINKIIVK